MRFLIILLLVSCGSPHQSSSKLSELIDSSNDPRYLPHPSSSLEYSVNNLPLEGNVDRLWSGWWWPMSEGGTSSTRYGMSPLAKYDLVSNTKANPWEIQNAKRYSSIKWAGKCNGLAAAGVMMEEPIKDVNYRNVTFTVTDIKALLTDSWQGSGYIIGGRCSDERITYDQYGRIEQRECRDVNPATFHIAITNYLGLFKKGIIADVNNTSSVWNYIVESYKVLYQKPLTRQDAIRLVQNNSSQTYIFNPYATSFVQVKLNVQYFTYDSVTYDYVLELDSTNKIIGGEWIGSSKRDHPDFIWRPANPKTDNPYLDFNIVYDIYRLSL